jgi:hypothetical protein
MFRWTDLSPAGFIWTLLDIRTIFITIVTIVSSENQYFEHRIDEDRWLSTWWDALVTMSYSIL